MTTNIDLNYVLNFTKELLEIPSPVGYTEKAKYRVIEELKKYNIPYFFNKKGTLIATIEGENNLEGKMISAHIDTIGAMVKKIKSNGRLELIQLGGIIWSGVEAENLKVLTIDGKIFEGTLLPNKASAHVYGDDARTITREASTMEVRLDEEVYSKEDTENLGISIGDFIAFDPRTVITKNGFIKSRFLDDKLCIGQIFGYIKFLKENKLKPKNKLYICFSDYEEIGYGVSYIPEDAKEFIALDIGLVSPDSQGDEKKVAITIKDNRAVYDLDIRKKMMEICKNNNIKYTTDIYNRYSSDASVVVQRGADIKIACIGPSVDASHHYERTHISGVLEVIKLLINYL